MSGPPRRQWDQGSLRVWGQWGEEEGCALGAVMLRGVVADAFPTWGCPFGGLGVRVQAEPRGMGGYEMRYVPLRLPYRFREGCAVREARRDGGGEHAAGAVLRPAGAGHREYVFRRIDVQVIFYVRGARVGMTPFDEQGAAVRGCDLLGGTIGEQRREFR